MKQLVIKRFFYFGDLSWSVAFYFLHFTKNNIYFHNHVSQSAELSLSFKNDVKISRHYLSVSNSAGAL